MWDKIEPSKAGLLLGVTEDDIRAQHVTSRESFQETETILLSISLFGANLITPVNHVALEVSVGVRTMDAFCGFVRGIRGKSEELGVFYVEMRAFSSQFSTTCWEKIFFGPPLWLEPPPEYIRFFQNSRATFASSPFSYRGKSHRVRLRGVDPKIHRKRPKKERLKN